jgi:hypothetical protein
MLGGTVGAVYSLGAGGTARGTPHAHHITIVVVARQSLAAHVGLVEHSVVPSRAGEALTCIVTKQAVIGTARAHIRVVAEVLSDWTLALAQLLEKSEAKDAGSAVIQRYAGCTPGRAEQNQPRCGVLEISNHSNAASSRGKCPVILARAVQALALRIAGETVIRTANACKRCIVRNSSERTGRVAQMVRVDEESTQTAQAV